MNMKFKEKDVPVYEATIEFSKKDIKMLKDVKFIFRACEDDDYGCLESDWINAEQAKKLIHLLGVIKDINQIYEQ